jgi:hypothetical protein
MSLLALQLWALVILVLDELPVRLSGDDELLWRMFFRRCGMTRKEFQHVSAQTCSGHQGQQAQLAGTAHMPGSAAA